MSNLTAKNVKNQLWLTTSEVKTSQLPSVDHSHSLLMMDKPTPLHTLLTKMDSNHQPLTSQLPKLIIKNFKTQNKNTNFLQNPQLLEIPLTPSLHTTQTHNKKEHLL